MKKLYDVLYKIIVKIGATLMVTFFLMLLIGGLIWSYKWIIGMLGMLGVM